MCGGCAARYLFRATHAVVRCGLVVVELGTAQLLAVGNGEVVAIRVPVRGGGGGPGAVAGHEVSEPPTQLFGA